MKPSIRGLCARFTLIVFVIPIAANGCATTKSVKSAHVESKKTKSRHAKPANESFALLDDSSTVDPSILKRGAKVRGSDFGY